MRYIIADPQPLARVGIRRCLKGPVLAEVGSLNQLLEQLGSEPADLLILDLNLTSRAPEEWLPLICQRAPAMKILICTTRHDRALVKQAVRCGVQGYILKTEPVSDFAQAVRCLSEGASWFSQPVLSEVVQARADLPPGRLTAREVEVLRLVRQGRKNRDIGVVLGLAEQTVCNYVRNIFDKLHIQRRVEVALWDREQLQAACAL
jgi:DNA-binding NarL/FixJ family response regulator